MRALARRQWNGYSDAKRHDERVGAGLRMATSRTPTVAVLGGGSWGTTVASTCARNTPTLLWARAPDTVREINEQHTNSRYLGELPLTAALRATEDLDEAVRA